MPKKTQSYPHYLEPVRKRLKMLRTELGGAKQMYISLYGTEPTDNEVKVLNTYISRGVLSCEFIGLCAERLGLGELTLNELFELNIEKSNSNEQKTSLVYVKEKADKD